VAILEVEAGRVLELDDGEPDRVVDLEHGVASPFVVVDVGRGQIRETDDPPVAGVDGRTSGIGSGGGEAGRRYEQHEGDEESGALAGQGDQVCNADTRLEASRRARATTRSGEGSPLPASTVEVREGCRGMAWLPRAKVLYPICLSVRCAEALRV
jgi:hypothetical protein